MSQVYSGAKVWVENPGEAPGLSIQAQDLSEDTLPEESVLLKVQYSSVNYKDALAVTGKGKILRKFPLTPGIDLAGEVVATRSKQWNKGDLLLGTGQGFGEQISGGFANYCVAPAEKLTKVPKGWQAKQAMTLGTAGFTAGLAALRMRQVEQTSSSDYIQGPILITGASGGVGSVATALFHKLDFEVWALSGKKEQHAYLKSLGAAKVWTPDDFCTNVLKFEGSPRPLEKGILGGIVDSVGGDLLAKLIPYVSLWGNVASIGLAASAELGGSVMPHILRGVSILGISSGNCPPHLRKSVWELLAESFSVEELETFVEEVVILSEVYKVSQELLARKRSKRTLVNLS
jgi:NADPH2:quinone reductase